MYLEPLCEGLAKAGRNFLAAGPDPANLPWEELDVALFRPPLLVAPTPVMLPVPTAAGVTRLLPTVEVW